MSSRPPAGAAQLNRGALGGGQDRERDPLSMLPLMPKGSIDRLADVPIRWLVLGLLLAGIWIFVTPWTDRSLEDRYARRTEGETLRIAVGEELELTFQTIGPG